MTAAPTTYPTCARTTGAGQAQIDAGTQWDVARQLGQPTRPGYPVPPTCSRVPLPPACWTNAHRAGRLPPFRYQPAEVDVLAMNPDDAWTCRTAAWRQYGAPSRAPSPPSATHGTGVATPTDPNAVTR